MKRNQGAILLLALLGLTTVSILAGTFVQMGMYEQRFSERSQNGVQAFYLSESALDQGLSWLRGQLVAPQWTDRRVLFNWQSLGDGVYTTVIDPDDNNPTSQIKRYTIEGWGVAGTAAVPLATRQTRMVVQTESFAQYAYFTDTEVSPDGMHVWFITGDRIEGPTHTNGQFRMYGKPAFEGSVSSVNKNIVLWGGPKFSQPVFKESPKLGVPEKKFPDTYPASITEAAKAPGGIVLKGDSAVTLLPNGTMQVTNTKKGLKNEVLPLPKNGVLYVDGGNLSLQGTLKGQLTVGASNDIKVVDSVTYATDPRRDASSKDILGIVAGGNVVVPKEAPHNLQIHGSVMALKSSFGVENYWAAPPKGTLSIYGGLIQEKRGPVGRFDPARGIKVSGYTKDYRYDPRLKGMSPPAFPTTGDYKTLVWQEGE